MSIRRVVLASACFIATACGDDNDGGTAPPQSLPTITAIRIEERLPSMFRGDTLQLHVDIEFDGPEDPDSLVTVTWSSLDPDIATVDSDGIVTAVDDLAGARVVATVGGFADTVRLDVVRSPFGVENGLSYLEIGSPTRLYRASVDGSPRIPISDSTLSVQSYDWPDIRGLLLTTYDVGGDSVLSVAGPSDGTVADTLSVPTPDGRWEPGVPSRIAFRERDSGDLAVLDVNFTSPSIVTNVAGSKDAWSPDGRRIAFLTDRGELRAAQLDGIEMTTYEALGTILDFRWSPDGKRLSFRTSGSAFTIAARGDGSTLRNLAPTCAGDGTCPSPINYGTPGWASDARRVAFWGRANEGCFVYVVEASTRVAEAVIPTVCGEGPLWSPDDSWLAIASSDADPDGHAVLLLRPDGSERRVLPADGPVQHIQWRP